MKNCPICNNEVIYNEEYDSSGVEIRRIKCKCNLQFIKAIWETSKDQFIYKWNTRF